MKPWHRCLAISMVYLPGLQDTVADSWSRHFCLDPEWELNDAVL